MAFITNSAKPFGLLDRVADLWDAMKTNYAQKRIYRTTINELSQLSGRELADLGISRANIRSIAYEAAYGE